MSKTKNLSAEAQYLARLVNDFLLDQAKEIAELKNANYSLVGSERWATQNALAVALFKGLDEMLLRERRVAADANTTDAGLPAKPFDVAKFARPVCGVPEVNDEPLG